MTTAQNALSGGFGNAAVDAAHAFRAAMTVMARPGEIARLDQAAPPAPISKAAGTLILTLCDGETGIHLAGVADNPAVRDWIAFHTGAPVVAARDAVFAVGRWGDLMPLDRFPIGCAEYPDRSATLIVECDDLTPSGAVLTGPGIKTAAHLALPDIAALSANHRLYPLGLDFFFTADTRVAGLPRSTAISEG
ncbi:MAG: phosphonate C-P lyase system protein PhnH [Marinibacterium sp.]